MRHTSDSDAFHETPSDFTICNTSLVASKSLTTNAARVGPGTNVNRPSSIRHALKRVFVCAIITCGKNKVPLSAGGAEALECFAFTRPHRPYVNGFVTTESSQRRSRFLARGGFARVLSDRLRSNRRSLRWRTPVDVDDRRLACTDRPAHTSARKRQKESLPSAAFKILDGECLFGVSHFGYCVLVYAGRQPVDSSGQEPDPPLFPLVGAVPIMGHVCPYPKGSQHVHRSHRNLQGRLQKQVDVSKNGAARADRKTLQGTLSQVC